MTLPTTPRRDFSLVFPPDPRWVRPTREAVRTLLAAVSRDDLVDEAVLLASETVTNAVRACLDTGVREPVRMYGAYEGNGTFTVSVHDQAPGRPTAREAGDEDEGGRGLELLAGCAKAWGVCGHGPEPGKSVWFELGGTDANADAGANASTDASAADVSPADASAAYPA
jgi:anti-sigma regulatory factor (Ser/Thr protein kinase)